MENNYKDTLKGRKILVVEDIDTNFELIKLSLLSTGVDIERAENGEVALQQFFSEDDFDLILMDIRLPGMDGYEVTQRIREKDQKIPIIAHTALVMRDEMEKAIEVGCNLFIAKPTDKSLLVSSIVRMIQKTHE
ncbi:MAG: response regulator [Bacteroidales bacterium]|nr:response regulator [Bacteroidales bacterium]